MMFINVSSDGGIGLFIPLVQFVDFNKLVKEDAKQRYDSMHSTTTVTLMLGLMVWVDTRQPIPAVKVH